MSRQPNSKPAPPAWLIWLMERYLSRARQEDVLGDLYELFYQRVKREGEKKASAFFLRDTLLLLLRPNLITIRPTSPTTPASTHMLPHYLTVAFRHLKRQKAFSLINIGGLSLGLAFCLLIFLFVKNEYSFDRFHANAEHIYRLELNLSQAPSKHRAAAGKGLANPTSGRFSTTLIALPLPLGPALKREMPEVEAFVRLKEVSTLVSNGKDSFKEKVHFTDATFFDVFSFEVVQGVKENALAHLSNIVITEQMASKYFGKQNPIGQTLYIPYKGSEKGFLVSGVVKEAPHNSSIRFTMLLRIEQMGSYEQYKQVMQSNFSVFTFLVLSKKASLPLFTAKLQAWVDRRFEAFSDMHRGHEKLPQRMRVLQVGILPLSDTHFDTRVLWPNVTNPVYAYILTGIGLLILLVACINYISLTLTGAASRIAEIGIRKVMGAGRWQVIYQLWMESQVLVWGAIVVAIGLVYLFLPFFNRFTEKALSFTPWQEPFLVGVLLLTALLVGMAAGGYPAIVLSGFKPTSVLKGTSTYRLNPSFSRVLLVFQYSMCLFLISCSLIMYRQMRYISEKDLGFDKERVLIVENSSGWGEQTTRLVSRFKQWSATSSHIASVSGATATITKGGISMGMEINKAQTDVAMFSIDEQYLPTLGIELVEGKNFSASSRIDQEGMLVNETLAGMLGRDSSGAIEPLMGTKVIGVVKDHHYASLESKIGPIAFFYGDDMVSYFLIKLHAGHVREGLQEIERGWKKLAPDQPFIYSFLEENLQEQYHTYQNWVRIVGIATAFALLIACLGLYALSGLTAVNRTKEIGIRKVMGASAKEIFLLLNRGTVGIILLSFAMAIPFAAYLMHKWLEDFAYRISLTADVFMLAGAIGLLTALLAVSYHSLRAAQQNPTDSLREE